MMNISDVIAVGGYNWVQVLSVRGKFISVLKTQRHTDIRRKGGKAPAKFNNKSMWVIEIGTGGNYIQKLVIKLLWLWIHMSSLYRNKFLKQRQRQKMRFLRSSQWYCWRFSSESDPVSTGVCLLTFRMIVTPSSSRSSCLRKNGLINPECHSTTILWIIGNYLPVNTASLPRSLQVSSQLIS
jgi:hypothetical protein